MKLRWTSVAWSVVYLLLLLSLATPLTVVTAFFLIVPGVLLYATLSTKSFSLHILPVWVIAAWVYGPLILLQAVYFLIPAIVMGHMYKKRVSALRTVMSGAGAILVEFLLILLISTVFFNFNLAESIEDLANLVVALLQNVSDTSMSEGAILSPELSQQFSVMVQLIPYTIIVSSLTIALIAHAIVRPTLASMGQAVPKLPPFRDWRLPRSLIWYYLIGILIQLFVGPSAQEGFLGTILLNMIPLLQFFFMIQTVSFFFFAAYHRKWNPVIPILLVIPVVLIPILPLWIIGIMDIAYPLRERITRSGR
ncbi:Uncharacterized conserved protein YybS, DUF2232 family [Fontibacillus panacisegetis]|uniref:Uncharacterized conserved protein YybS, DUF2232 family n=1 Tax=Fontibacillus panacisegetis TaxID=670482 RepID=A0A1G7LE74_9BACL|nr:DUF2232 domain-containing protein [Fontibacillus panacisegetis]SDF47778.1 Uncharacterized conserved protein YybS, DUF2232 family [Fontibacillus panacisegetis]